jgi:hypothetical protein
MMAEQNIVNEFARRVSKQWLGKQGQRATMEDVFHWTNIIARY